MKANTVTVQRLLLPPDHERKRERQRETERERETERGYDYVLLYPIYLYSHYMYIFSPCFCHLLTSLYIYFF